MIRFRPLRRGDAVAHVAVAREEPLQGAGRDVGFAIGHARRGRWRRQGHQASAARPCGPAPKPAGRWQAARCASPPGAPPPAAPPPERTVVPAAHSEGRAPFYGRDMLARHHQEVLAAFVEERCLQQAQSMPLEWFEHNEHYDLLHRVRGRTVGRLGHTMSFLWESLSLFVALMSLLLYLGQFHWGLPVLLAIGTTPGVLLRERLLSQRYLMEHAQTPQERRFEVYTGLMTGRESAAEIRLFSLGRWLLGQAGELRRGLHAERLQLAAHEARRTVVSDGLNGVVHILAIGLSVGLLVNGHISIGAAAALFAAIESFQVNYADLIWGVSLLNNDLRYLQDFFALMDTPRVDLKAGRRLEHVITGPIVMESVSFTYPGAARPALSNIDLSLRPGERIALAGENGAGKTTLVKLLMGLYQDRSMSVTRIPLDD